MDTNNCGFPIREIDIEEEFSSRNSITSLLNTAASAPPGGGGVDPAGGSSLHHSFFESIATYLDNINPRSESQMVLRKGGEVQTEMENNNTSTTAETAVATRGLEYNGGAAEQFETASASQWQAQAQQQQSSSSRGSTNGTGGRVCLDPAAASKVGKKRSRASRRAPTTVLTTDTSNFRAMVQEFTGIPPAPFATASPFPRNRLDFLGPRSLHGGNPFLLRPFPQRMAAGAQAFPLSAPSFQLPQATPPNLLFQSLLQPGAQNLLNKTANASVANPSGLLEELGLNAHVLPDLVPSDRRWAGQDGAGAACKMSYNKSVGDQGRTRTLNLEESMSNAANHHHHNNNNNLGRPDGMVDSWISSSDQTLDKLVQ